jgi:glyoxylase-like metal-dependent hydrolase (beta-lactamase superfamily II)
MTGRLLPVGAGGPWSGGEVGERAVCVLAPNPGPMTLDGTNTWVLAEPGADRVVVVDPGPDDPRHLDAVEAALQGRRAARILLTHGHPDHSEGAAALAQRTGAPVLALDPAYRLGTEGLAHGDVVEVDGLLLEVVATPGHSPDSLSFHVPAAGALITGDTVLGRGTTVVEHPEGTLADYLDSLARLRDLAASTDGSWVLPGHGPALADPAGAVTAYLEHRRARLDQVRASLGPAWREQDEADVVERVLVEVYAEVPVSVHPAARLSIRAQLAYLRERP